MFSDQQALFLKETLQVIPHSMRINMPDKLTVELGSREPLNQYKRAIYHHYSLSFWNRVWDKKRERWVTWPALRLFECIFFLVVIGETLSFSAQAAASPLLLLLSDTQQVAQRKIIEASLNPYFVWINHIVKPFVFPSFLKHTVLEGLCFSNIRF